MTSAVSRERIRIRFYVALMIADVAALVLPFLAFGLFSREKAILDLEFASLSAPVFLVFAINGRVYSVQSLARWRRGAVRAAGAAFLALLLTVGIVAVTQLFRMPSRLAVVCSIPIAMITVAVVRAVGAMVARRSFGGALISEAVLVDAGDVPAPIGNGPTIISARALGLTPKFDPAMLDRIGRTIAPFDRLIVACAPGDRRAWGQALKGSGIPVEMIIPELEEIGPLDAGRYGGLPTVTVAEGGLELRERVLKRSLDLAVALPSMVIFLPVLCVIGILIKLDSKGTILFRQERVGEGNKIFCVYKFRTMYSDLTDAKASKLVSRGDSRVTRVGGILRRTSIDELPQIINILRGDMSLVGPRPHAVGALAGESLYWEVDERYFHRHAAKPGLTGLAQVRGFRGNTETTDDLVNRLQADLEYIAGWSIWRDVAIILRTIRVVVHPNAY